MKGEACEEVLSPGKDSMWFLVNVQMFTRKQGTGRDDVKNESDVQNSIIVQMISLQRIVCHGLKF